jgi:hypothetical protein
MDTSTLPSVPEQRLRNADAATLLTTLRDRHAAKLDIVAPTNGIRLFGGNFLMGGLDEVDVPEQPAKLTPNGVTEAVPGFSYDPSGMYRPTYVVDQDIASLLDIPVRYVRKMRDQDVELLDINVNRWAEKEQGNSLFRLLRGSSEAHPGTLGIVRAVRSDRYAIIDHLDTVMSILSGLREAGLDGSNIKGIDLSDEKLYLNVEVPEIAVHGRSLIENYRSPFTGQTGAELPLVHAGLKFTNSEIGRGAFEITPFAVFQVCKNGATINAHKLRKVHLGKVLEPGQIKWSQETLAAANELVRNQVRDAVGSFLSTDFLTGVVDEWEREAGVEVIKPADTGKVIGKELQYTEAEQDAILASFIKGGDMGAFAIGHAVTAAVQDFEDPDRAHEVGESHLAAVRIAARVATKVEV